jgi:glycosyltransferase involved in cell wall biosynthesis
VSIPSRYTKLSILVPVYNERYLVTELLDRVRAAPLPDGLGREIVVVDDGSTDGTRERLAAYAAEHPDEVTLLLQERNQGKGAAIARAVEAASGDIILFQDADLEYDPNDYAKLLQPILAGDADVVYGSRFLPGGPRRALFFRHSLGNKLLTLLSNFFTDLNLTDMETCYKVFRASLLKSIPLRCKRFGIEPEITAKIATRGFRVYEVPISYHGRTYREGKKITWWDGVKALGVILKYWLIDDAYGGPAVLRSFAETHRYNRWITDTVRPCLGNSVLEVGAGIGTISALLLPRERYVATDIDEVHLTTLANRFWNIPHVETARLDVRSAEDAAPFAGQMDTVVCVNVLEHIDDHEGALRHLRSVLKPGGCLFLLVPRGKRLFGTLDQVVDHHRRYEKDELRQLLEAAGFTVEHLRHFNRAGVPGWWLNGRVLRRRHFSKLQLKLYDSLVGLFRRLDHVLPWGGLSLIAVARRTGE